MERRRDDRLRVAGVLQARSLAAWMEKEEDGERQVRKGKGIEFGFVR